MLAFTSFSDPLITRVIAPENRMLKDGTQVALAVIEFDGRIKESYEKAKDSIGKILSGLKMLVGKEVITNG